MNICEATFSNPSNASPPSARTVLEGRRRFNSRANFSRFSTSRSISSGVPPRDPVLPACTSDNATTVTRPSSAVTLRGVFGLRFVAAYRAGRSRRTSLGCTLKKYDVSQVPSACCLRHWLTVPVISNSVGSYPNCSRSSRCVWPSLVGPVTISASSPIVVCRACHSAGTASLLARDKVAPPPIERGHRDVRGAFGLQLGQEVLGCHPRSRTAASTAVLSVSLGCCHPNVHGGAHFGCACHG